MTPRTRFILTHPVRARRHHRAVTAPWPPMPEHQPTGDTAMNIGRSHTAILDEMVDNGEITAEQAADDWHESHADDDHDRDADREQS